MKRMDVVWVVVLCAVTTVLAIPASRAEFTRLTTDHPYLMGFVKFAILASMGELASLRILSGGWKVPRAMPARTVIWGLIGMLIVLMFKVYTDGVSGAATSGYIRLPGGWAGSLLQAFLISAVMNLTFGPMFMAAHRITDTWLDRRTEPGRPSLGRVVAEIDWIGFIRFVIGKTIPLFWIPAHTITFLLPPEFRVVYAAYLSIALGAILAYARRKNSPK